MEKLLRAFQRDIQFRRRHTVKRKQCHAGHFRVGAGIFTAVAGRRRDSSRHRDSARKGCIPCAWRIYGRVLSLLVLSGGLARARERRWR